MTSKPAVYYKRINHASEWRLHHRVGRLGRYLNNLDASEPTHDDDGGKEGESDRDDADVADENDDDGFGPDGTHL